MFVDISLHSLGRAERRGQHLVSFAALTQGRVRNADPVQVGIQNTVHCAQVENDGLLGPPQSLAAIPSQVILGSFLAVWSGLVLQGQCKHWLAKCPYIVT